MKSKKPIEHYLEGLKASRKFGPQVVCHNILDPIPVNGVEPSAILSEQVVTCLRGRGMTELYSHQAKAFQLLDEHRDIIVATPTASGKSLIYNLPVLQKYLEDNSSRALYLFPLKALAQDQHLALEDLSSAMEVWGKKGGNFFSAVYDGDTIPRVRAKLRKRVPPVLITNPEMLHLSLLPYHDSWSELFRNLRYIIVDEIHTYRGLFGAHMSWVLKRLLRICSYYGSNPQYVMLSATIGNPGHLARSLTGREPACITKSGAPRAKKHFLFLNPWDSAAHTTSQLLEAGLKRGLRTIVYTKSRRMTELITMWTRPRLGKLAAKLSSYRAGFLPEQRRTIEKKLSSGELLGVISTSALELGIDIGDLDLCILVGYPGSVMATWQRSGRVGRKMNTSATIFIAAEDALDQHFMRDPEDFFSRSAENAALNPLNPTIARQHLHCGAAELALSRSEPLVHDNPEILSEIEHLAEQAVLHQDQSGDLWHASRKRPHRLVSLRGGGVQFAIIHSESGEVIGEIDAGRALKETHPGGVYIHHSQILEVIKLELLGHEVIVRDVKPNYYTRPIVKKNTEILNCETSRSVFGCRVSWGRVRVTEHVTGYQRVNNFTQKTISTQTLDLPEQVIETESLWLDLADGYRRTIEQQKMHFMGAIHALEHAMIAMFPLLILCDRNDIGGISCPHHEQTGTSSIFIYDGYSGGAGLAREAYELMEKLLLQTEKTILSCGCELGCPSCVHSPKCGSGNRPIDKEASLALLQAVLAGEISATKSSVEQFKKTKQDRAFGELDSSMVTRGKQAYDYPTGKEALPGHYCVFDLETQRSAKQVGGWNRAEKMGLSVGVVYDSKLDGYVTYLEDEAGDLVKHLRRAELVVGFNIRRFDYRVLSAYADKNLFDLPTLDILELVYTRLGYRLSLGRLALETLGYSKSADGLQALKWYQEGKIREIVYYCRKDVEITKDLLLYGLENQHLLFRNKAGAVVRLVPGFDKEIWKICNSPGDVQGQSNGL